MSVIDRLNEVNVTCCANIVKSVCIRITFLSAQEKITLHGKKELWLNPDFPPAEVAVR